MSIRSPIWTVRTGSSASATALLAAATACARPSSSTRPICPAALIAHTWTRPSASPAVSAWRYVLPVPRNWARNFAAPMAARSNIPCMSSPMTTSGDRTSGIRTIGTTTRSTAMTPAPRLVRRHVRHISPCRATSGWLRKAAMRMPSGSSARTTPSRLYAVPSATAAVKTAVPADWSTLL